MGLLRPSFVPPPEIRALRDLTRTRLQLVRDRTRAWQRLEKLLEGALIKLSSGLSSLAKVKTARLILEALAGGERDPQGPGRPRPGQLRARRAALEAALDGMMLGAHHALLIRDPPGPHRRSWTAPSPRSRTRSTPPWRRSPPPGASTADGSPSPDPGPGAAVLPAAARLAEIPGVSPDLAMAIIAETGLDMTGFPTAAHLVSWAGLAPVARQSGPRTRKPKKGQGNAYLKGYCTQAANGAAQHRHLPRRAARPAGPAHRRRTGPSAPSPAPSSSSSGTCSNDPAARYPDLGPDWHDRKTDRDKKIRRPPPPAPGPRPRRHHHPRRRLNPKPPDQARDPNRHGPLTHARVRLGILTVSSGSRVRILPGAPGQ